MNVHTTNIPCQEKICSLRLSAKRHEKLKTYAQGREKTVTQLSHRPAIHPQPASLRLGHSAEFGKFGGDKANLRTIHASLGSIALGILFIHAFLGLNLGLSF